MLIVANVEAISGQLVTRFFLGTTTLDGRIMKMQNLFASPLVGPIATLRMILRHTYRYSLLVGLNRSVSDPFSMAIWILFRVRNTDPDPGFKKSHVKLY